MIVKSETNITNNKVKAVGKIKDAGITMIALVVTIVVLLILASITIGAVTSENGILRNANDAKEQTEIAEEKEIVEDKSPGNITKDENGDDLKGDEDEPYEIWCIEDLIEWSNNYEDYQYNNINLCTNLNFKSKHSYANSERTDYGDINEDNITDTLIQEMQKGKGFSPINSFSGVFNGNRFEIENIYIVNNGNVGLFRQINGAIICDFGISGYIESTQINNIQNGVGGILGYTRDNNADVNIYNSYNSGNISSNKSSYGIMGGIWVEGTCNIENCVNIGETQIGICRTADNISVNNIYYLDSASNTGGITNAIAVSENELCSEQFIKTLNDYINEETYKSNWKYWTLGEDGYPTFK